jgi:phage protein D
MGYVDDLQEMMEGEITQISPSFPESGTPTVTISGNSKMHWLHASKTTRTFKQMTDTQIVQQIAQEAGLATQTDDSQVIHEYVMQANQTDLEFITARAARIHYEVLVDGPMLIFRKANEGASKIFTLVWGNTQAGLAAGPNTLPLKSFSTTMNALQPPTSVQVRGWDAKNKTGFVGNATTGSEDAPMAGSQTASQVTSGAFNKPRQEVQVSIPVASQAEADQHAKALLNNLGMKFVTGNAVTIGVPELFAGSVVALQGLGPLFSGFYYVDSATHTVGKSGYQTELSVKRNSI